MDRIKKLFKTTGTRNGSFSIGMTAIVIGIVVVVNLILGQLPEKYKNIDVSTTKIYEITDTSKELLKDLDHKVTLKVLAVKENTDDRIKTFLSKYAALSKHISVEWVDPVLHPSALSEYETQENTIVVSCEDTKKSTTVSFENIIVVDTSSYYYTGSATESEFDGEGQLTSAVNYVTNDVTKKIYRTTGHGEATLSGSVMELMDKNNYQVEELNLVMQNTIPEDCDLLMMYAPSKDLTEDEKTVLQTYLSGGGKAMLLLGQTSMAEMPNMASVMKDYGMEVAEGYIADQERAYQGNYYYIFPQLLVAGDMAKGIFSQMVLVTNVLGMNIGETARDTITTESFMTTSDGAYAVTEDDQTAGTYSLGAVATEDESRLTVISAGSLIDSQITDTFTQLENTTLFMNAISSNFDGVQNISIEPKSLTVEYNTVQHAGLLSLFAVFGLPILVLASGFAVWYKRRKA